MKFSLASDVHLEFGQLEVKNTEKADVLLLSGDIIVACSLLDKDDSSNDNTGRRSKVFHKFFQNCCAEFPHVIYVGGNHEHYHGDFAKTFGRLNEHLSYLTNLHILDKMTYVLDDVTFIGGTLWTDFNNEDPLTLLSIKEMMNDFQCVKNSNNSKGRFTPFDALSDHKSMLQFINDTVDNRPDDKFVVVGHHQPSKKSTKPMYENDVLVNGAYSSNLDQFIIDRPQIKIWTGGHTHHDFDYMIGSTRILCRPRGYIGYESQADTFKLEYFEV